LKTRGNIKEGNSTSEYKKANPRKLTGVDFQSQQAPKQKVHQNNNDEEIHPSWIAKKKEKLLLQQVVKCPQGKKTVFED
jgi:hypothetical protein